MITVKVTYGVKEEFKAQNKANIELFMKDFEAFKSSDFSYDVYTLDDTTTFIHISRYTSADIQQQVLNTPSFMEFQRQRDESGLIKPHTVQMLHAIASTDY